MKPRSTPALWLRPAGLPAALGSLGGGALAGAGLAGLAPGTVASSALKALKTSPSNVPPGILLPRIWVLRQNLTAYDAAYVALAETLEATLLVTRDSRIRRAPGHFARVEVF